VSRILRTLAALAVLAAPLAALAAGDGPGQAAKQATNWTAITMFAIFVMGTLWITKWAARAPLGGRLLHRRRRHHRLPERPGHRRRLHVGASFLGISAAVMATGYDGLIYSIGFLVGWPVITFLMAERLRNLGKFTFADVAGYRFKQTPIRAFAASGTLVVVAFYLIAQMVGRGPADQAAVRPRLLDRRGPGRRPDDGLRAVRRHDRPPPGCRSSRPACCWPA
jgi:cation/acetate symporter